MGRTQIRLTDNAVADAHAPDHTQCVTLEWPTYTNPDTASERRSVGNEQLIGGRGGGGLDGFGFGHDHNTRFFGGVHGHSIVDRVAAAGTYAA